MLDDLKIFICAAEKRSLTATAEHLGMTIATVSRRIHALEESLDCELIHRSTKGLTLTPTGEAYYQECSGFVEALDQRLSNLDQALHSLSGELKVLAPTNLGSGPLDDFWCAFIATYPDIQLTVELANAYQDLRDSKAEIALRSGKQINSSLIQKHLGSMDTILVASPSASFALPSNLVELKNCPSVAATMFADWTLFDAQNHCHPLEKAHKHTCNDMSFTVNLVENGTGIALLPMSMVHKALSSGRLVRVLPEWKGTVRDLYLVWPSRRSLSARAKKFREALVQFFAEQSWFSPAP